MAYLNVVIDSTYIDSDLTNHPVAIEIDATDSILSGIGATDYEGFHFTVGGVECYAQIDIWDTSLEYAYIWVLVPTVSSSSDTTIKVENVGDDNTAYVGITGSTPATTVWDSNSLAVYHMSQDPSVGGACILDSTSNAFDGTPGTTYLSSYSVYDGAGKAIDFSFLAQNSANQGINVPYNSAFNIQNLTIVGMIKVNTANGLDLIATKRYASASAPYNSFNLDVANSSFRFLVNNVESTYASHTNWVVLVGTYDGSNRKFYVDGTLVDSSSQSVTIPYSTLGFYIGDYGQAFEFNGRISEVQVHNTARSADWIKAISNNLLGNLISSKTYVETSPGTGVYGKISINGKYVNILAIKVLEKGQWRTVEETYMLIDKGWRQNIIS